MKQSTLKVSIGPLSNRFLKINGSFDKKRALEFYNYNADAIYIEFCIQNIPRILTMILNGEHKYSSSISVTDENFMENINNIAVSSNEKKLYQKWVKIFKNSIEKQYSFSDNKKQKLAQDNANYLITVFTPINISCVTSLRQINYIASWMLRYVNTHNHSSNDFEKKLCCSMVSFINELCDLNVIDDGLFKNETKKSLSLFGITLDNPFNYYGEIYSTNYKGSFLQLAEAQKHKAIDYQIELTNDKEYFIPPIIANEKTLTDEWLGDMITIKNITPQGEMIKINEMGKYDDFILKCNDELCTMSQLEIMLQTKDTLLKYKKFLEKSNSILAKNIANYCQGARCTFPGRVCSHDCKLLDGKNLTRKI